ncbi:MAG TPA: NTP transferase domain-containing protein, partial [Rhizobiaceae bacterium]|nr:NTP transferase domain-containing protein [Rhizobiaceae bacterium]
MGGGDKCLADLAGRPLLSHVLDRLRPQTGAVALSANGDPARFSAFGMSVLPDPVDGFAGPLAGLLAGLQWATTLPGVTHLLSVAADTPFL